MNRSAIIIERLCTEFESQWRSGQRPVIAALLDQTGEDHERLLRELLLLEIELRSADGEHPRADDYVRELPDYAHVVATVFRELEDEATLRSSDGNPARPAAHLPDRVGHFELDEVIGRGGMGVVYRAHDTALDRWVALKMIAAGRFSSPEAVERFRAEAAAAAKLDHQNIVPIFEAGTKDEQHYISMALVDGPSLQTAMADGPCEPRRAAQLLEPVCRAVQHAHDHQVIHRDLKPANILLARNGQPRITDFGLAKHIGDDRHLTVSHQLLGTPGYMSPEQAAGRGSMATPATDIYALGAVLYWLLTGRPPFQAATLTATIRQVAEQDPVAPRQLNPDIPRDLETLALRCLAKDPHQRLSSANELADELGRYQRGEPIHSRPLSWATRTWRWTRRNPLVAGLTSALVIALVAGSTISLALGYRANRNARAAMFEAGRATAALTREQDAREAADLEADRANSIRDYLLLDMIRAAGPESLGPNVTVANVLDLAVERAGSRFADRPELEAAVRHVVGEAYVTLGRLDDARVQLTHAEAMYRDLYPPDDLRVLELTSALGTVEYLKGQHEESRLRLERAEALAADRHGSDAPITIRLQHALGETLQSMGRHEDAQPLLRRVVELAVKQPTTTPIYFRALSSLAGSLVATNAVDEAEEVYRLWLGAAQREYGTEHLATAAAIGNLASLLIRLKRLEEAEPLCRQSVEILEVVLAEGDWQLAMARGNWALCLMDLHRYDEAAPQLVASCELLTQAFGDDDYKTQFYLIALAEVQSHRNRWDDSVKIAQRVLVGRLRGHGPGEHGPIEKALRDVATYVDQAQGHEAMPCILDDITLAVESIEADDPRRVRAMVNWGRIAHRMEDDTNRKRAARQLLVAAVALARDRNGPDHAETRWATKELAAIE